MKKIIFSLCLFKSCLYGLEYEVQFENENLIVSKVKIMPSEEIGLHNDVYPQIVIALQGGTITRLESDGRTQDIDFATGVSVFREKDPPNELHKSINKEKEPVELLIIQLKT